MKMKKTFSLKLMLLGLLASVSTGALAQYTAVDGVVYGFKDATKKNEAVVVGVLKGEKLLAPMVTTTKAVKSIQIADQVTIPVYNSNGTQTDYNVPVVDFAENWMHANGGVPVSEGYQFKCNAITGTAGANTMPTRPEGTDDGSDWDVANGGQGATAPQKQLIYKTQEVAIVAGLDADKNPNPLELIIRASKMTEISKSDIVVDETGNILPIAAFIIGADCGIKDIPAEMFAVCTEMKVTSMGYTYYGGAANLDGARAKLAAEKKALENLLKGTYVVYNGKYQGKQVYKLTKNGATGAEITGDRYVFLNGEKAFNGAEKDAYDVAYQEIVEVKADGTLNPFTTFAGRPRVDNKGNETGTLVYCPAAGTITEFATKVADDFCMGPEGAIAGLNNELTEAQAEKAAADKAVADAEHELQIARLKESDPDLFATDDVAKKAAAERLEAAIAAFENNEEHPSYWPAIQQKVSQQTGTPVEDVTAWYVFYALATGQAEPSSWTYWRPLVNEGIAAYKEFYGKDIQTVGIPVKADAYAFTSYGVAGDIFHAGDATVTPSAEGISFTQYATGLVQDLNEQDGDYAKVKVLKNDIEDWTDKEFYVKATAGTLNPNMYYVLYEKDNEGNFVPVGEKANGARRMAPDAEGKKVTGTFSIGSTGLSISDVTATETGTGTACESSGNALTFYTLDENTSLGDFSGKTIGVDTNGAVYIKPEGSTCWVEYDNVADDEYGTYQGITEVPTPSEGGDTGETTEGATYASIVVVKIGQKTEVTIQTTTPDATAISAADPVNDIAKAKKAVKSVAEAEADLAKAQGEQTAAQEKIDGLTNEEGTGSIDVAEAELERLNGIRDPQDLQTKNPDKVEYVLDEEKPNKTLELVAFNNKKIETIGHHAFYNCVNAEFTGTFPATIDQIEEKAFANTQFKNLDLNNTNTIDRNEDEKINDADRLGDENIANDAFLNTPLETMLLANTNLSSSWIQTVARNIKFEEKEYTDECGDEYTRMVNETLTTVELPEATAELDGIETLACNKVLEGTFENCIALTAIAFPAQIDAIENNAFCGDDALATITFAPENSELVWIGEGAFYHAAATTIDLSAQTKLGSAYSWGENGGAFAFADMKNLESVNFTNTKIKSLPATIFNGDAKLATVTFYDAADPKSGSFIETLPAGIFKTNAIAVLDIAKTKITVLENLFQAGNGSQKAKDCNGNQIILDPFNETLTAVKLPAWLKEIKTNALAHMHNKDFKTVEIPGSVEELGEGVFGDDKYLETVSFFNYENDPAKKDFLDGSMLEELPAKTFAQCPNLKKVYFVTYETLENDCFGDNCFFSAGTSNTADDPRVEVYVNHDSFDALKSTTVYSSTYSKLMAFETTLKGTEIGDEYYKPWTSKYGTWIEAVDEGENAVGVYTAYQDGHKIILYPAKKSSFEGKSYYKIAAYDDDAAMAAIGMPAYQPTEDLTNTPTMPSWNGFFYNSIDERTEGLEVFTPFPAIGYTYDYPDGVIDDADLIPWQIGQTLEERVSFGNMGAWMGAFKPTTDILAKTWMALGTAIIVYSNPDGVPYIQKTNPDQKYQSTLDLANQLSVTHKDEPKDDDNNWYYLAKSNGKPKFKHHDSDDNIEFIPKGSVAFLQTTAQGQGAREFDIEIVSESEATAIGGVMDYISAKNSDAIYNLQGVRVTAPVKGQMYIQGGKKFIQK